MVLRAFMCALLTSAACDLAPLEREQLFGPPMATERDAAAADVNISDGRAGKGTDGGNDVFSPDVASAPDTRACQPSGNEGLLSGAVVDACTGIHLEAQVGVAGRHTCSFAGKGSYQFFGLPTGCVLTLTSAAPGYRLFMRTLTLPPGGSSVLIQLERATGTCADPAPPPTPCRCEGPRCE